MSTTTHDYDWLVIGSGFGGSVAALRLAKLGLKGILRLTLFKDAFIASGCGVGGGSLGYANTLYRARPGFYRDRQWSDLADWERELAPHYQIAERMLGVTTYDRDSAADLLLLEYAREHGLEDTYAKTCAAARAWSAAATTPRTPSSRTTCTSPSAQE